MRERCVPAGKKDSELGEYDPLTQADSEDESEEDDLVLNYPRNGLGSLNPRGGRSGSLVGSGDEAPEEEEEDEWRERLPSKSRLERDDAKGTQYWSPRDPGARDRAGEDRGGPAGPLGGSGPGDHGADAEKKRLRMKTAVRSAAFVVPLVCAALLVLLCAFLIPCQKGALGKRRQWERALGDAGGKEGVTVPRRAQPLIITRGFLKYIYLNTNSAIKRNPSCFYGFYVQVSHRPRWRCGTWMATRWRTCCWPSPNGPTTRGPARVCEE